MATTCAARYVCCWFWCCQAWLLLVLTLCATSCCWLLVLLGEDNKRKRALGREGSSTQRQVERTDLDNNRPVHLTRVRDPWDNTRREGGSMPLPSLLACLPGTMKKARIPPKLLLDAMMHQLGLPNAVYSTQKGRTVALDATIHFYGCKQDLNNGFPRKSMTIPVYGNLEKTEDQLAVEALKCMETTYSTVLQDLNYNKLQLVQEKCNTMEHQLEEKDGMINYFSNHWCSSLSGDRMAAKELYRIIDTNFTAGSTSKENNLNHILSQVRYVADHFNDTTTQSEYDLQRTNEYYWTLDDNTEGISALGNESDQSEPL